LKVLVFAPAFVTDAERKKVREHILSRTGGSPALVYVLPHPWFARTELKCEDLVDYRSIFPLNLDTHRIDLSRGLNELRYLAEYVDFIVFIGREEDLEIMRYSYGFLTSNFVLVERERP